MLHSTSTVSRENRFSPSVMQDFQDWIVSLLLILEPINRRLLYSTSTISYKRGVQPTSKARYINLDCVAFVDIGAYEPKIVVLYLYYKL